MRPNTHSIILTDKREWFEAYQTNPWFKQAFDVFMAGIPHHLDAMVAGAEKCKRDHDVAVELLKTMPSPSYLAEGLTK